MAIPDSPSNRDIREALLQLSQEIGELRQEVHNLNQKLQSSKEPFELRANRTDRLIQGAIWVIIAAAIVSVVSNFTTVILKTLSVNLVG
ncbi:MAG: hypothetical protein ACFBSG_00435 [Leptolyngbyaceae cyanobacterium]